VVIVKDGIKSMKKKSFLNKKRVLGKRFSFAVSEVIGIVLILAIVVAAMSVVYLFVFSPLSNHGGRTPAVDIIGTVTSNGTQIILEHRGGVALSGDIQVIVTYNEADHSSVLSTHLVGGVTSFSIGNRIVISPDGGDNLHGLQVSVRLIHPQSNSVLFDSMVQEGATAFFPIVQAKNVEILSSTEVELIAHYKRRQYTGDMYIEFQYREDTGNLGNDDNWNPSHEEIENYPVDNLIDVEQNPPLGDIPHELQNLFQSTDYQFRVYLRYFVEEQTKHDYSNIIDFKTGDALGAHWRFNEDYDYNTFFDETSYNNRGTIVDALRKQHGIDDKSFWFDGIDDYVTVSSTTAQTFNMITPTDQSLSLEAWVKISEDETDNTFYGVEKSVSDFKTFNSNPFPSFPDLKDMTLVEVGDDWYVVVGRKSTGTANQGVIISLKINSSGGISEVGKDIKIFTQADNTQYRCGSFPRVVRLNDEGVFPAYFAIVYSGDTVESLTYKYGHIYTFNVSNLGEITFRARNQIVVNDFFHQPDVMRIGNTTLYAIMYGSRAANEHDPTAKIQIREISPEGEISLSMECEVGFEVSGSGSRPAIYSSRLFYIKSEGNVHKFGGLYFDNFRIGYVVLFSYNTDSNELLFTKKDSFTASGMGGDMLSKIVLVSQENDHSIFAFTYGTATVTGGNLGNEKIYRIKTLKIYHDYTQEYLKEHIDIITSTTPLAFRPLDLLRLGESIYALTYNNYGEYGYNRAYLKFFNITDEGDISDFPDTISITSDWYSIYSRSFLQSLAFINKDDDCYYLAVSYVSTAGTWGSPELKTYCLTFDINDNSFTSNIIDVSELHTFNFIWPRIVHLADNKYVISYRDTFGRGALRTILINPGGVIDQDSLSEPYYFHEHVYQLSADIKIEKISNTLIAIFYRISTNRGIIKTIEINNDAFYEKESIDFHDAVSSGSGSISVVKVKENTGSILYSIIFRTTANTGGYCTINIIKNNGDIEIKKPADALPEGNNFANPAVTKVHDNTDSSILAALFTHQTSTLRYLHTYEIDHDTGEITNKGKFSWSSTHGQMRGDITSTSDGVVIFAYRNYNVACVASKKIDTSGTISEGDSFCGTTTAQNTRIEYPSIVHVTEDIYALSYRSMESNYPGYFLVFRVGSNAAITDYSITRYDDFQDIRFPNNNIQGIGVPHMIKMPNSANRFVVVHAGRDFFDAYITTLTIIKREFSPNLNFRRYGSSIISIGCLNTDYGFGLHLKENQIYARIRDTFWTSNDLQLERNNWNYIVFTYDRDETNNQIKLYLNGQFISQHLYSINIQYSDSHLFKIGNLKGHLDEMRIYNGEVLKQHEITNRWNTGAGSFG
jgi:hypothetical protein